MPKNKGNQKTNHVSCPCSCHAIKKLKCSKCCVIENDLEKKLSKMRPKVLKGRRQAKSRVPSKIIAKRAWHNKAIANFALDAIQDGIIVADGEGKEIKIKLENPSYKELLYYLDSDVVGRHREYKAKQDRKVEKVEIIAETMHDNFEMKAEEKTDIVLEKTREEKMIEEFKRREEALKEKKKKAKKKKSRPKTLEAARKKIICELMDAGIPLTIEAIDARMKSL